MACSLEPFSFSNGVVPKFQPTDLLVVDASGKADLSLGWCQVSQLISNVLGIMVYIVIPIATLAVIWGGFTFLTAAGDPGKIKKGKAILISALVGVAIVFSANIIIRAIFSAFGVDAGILPWS